MKKIHAKQRFSFGSRVFFLWGGGGVTRENTKIVQIACMGLMVLFQKTRG